MITLKKTLLISLFIHVIIFSLGAWDIFFRRRVVQWSVSPVELVNIQPEKIKEVVPKTIKKPQIKKEVPLKRQKIFKRIQKASKSLSEKLKRTPRKLKKEPSASSKTLPSSVEIKVERFPFNYYLDIIRIKINRNWHPQKGTGQAQVVIFFKILRNGKVKDISVEKTSGISFLDRSALRAIVQSEPFPPLPVGFNENYLGVHLTFKIEEFEF